MTCVFCQKIREGSVRQLNKSVVAFEPLNPVTPGHMLFVSTEHLPNASYKPVVTGHVMMEAAKYAAGYGNNNIITSSGKDATQTIFHLHIHVVPRRAGDNLKL